MQPTPSLPLSDLIARLSQGGAERCETTMAAIEAHGDAAVMPMLVALDGLGDRDDTEGRRQRDALLRLLGRLGEPQGVLGHLFAHLDGAGADAARWALVELCSRHPSAIGALLDFVPDAHDERVSALFAILRTLEAFARPEVVATMARWLDDAPDDWTTSNIESALIAAGDAAAPACEALLRAADRVDDADAGLAAGYLELAAPFAPRVVFARVEHLLAADLDGADELVSVLACLPRDDQARLERCRQIARRMLDLHGSTMCIDALGELGTRDDIEAIAPHLTGWSGQVVSAVLALQRLEAPDLAEHLQRAAPTWSAQTLREIAEIARDVPPLAQALLDASFSPDDRTLRPGLALALGHPLDWMLLALDVDTETVFPNAELARPGAHTMAQAVLQHLARHGDPTGTAAPHCLTWWDGARDLLTRLPDPGKPAQRRHAVALAADAALAWLATLLEGHATRTAVIDDLVAHTTDQRHRLRSTLGTHAHAGLLKLPDSIEYSVAWLTRAAHTLTHRSHIPDLADNTRLGHALFERRQELHRLQRLFPTHHPDEDLTDALDAIDDALHALARPHWRALLPERLHRELTADPASPDTLETARRDLQRRGAPAWTVAIVR